MTILQSDINAPYVRTSYGGKKAPVDRSTPSPEPETTDRYRVFKRDNPIHGVLATESGVLTPREINQAYLRLEKIFVSVKAKLKPLMTPEEKLKLFFQVLKQDFGFDLKEQKNDPLLAGNILRGKLDCDSSLLILLACAHELKWPVKLSDSIFGHIFGRWDDGKTRTNVSYGKIYTDQFYRQHFKLTNISTLNKDQILALAYSNRGIHKRKEGNQQGALEDYAVALRLNPRDALTHFNQGAAYFQQGDYGRAVASFNEVLRLNPTHIPSYQARGMAEQKRGDIAAAKANFNEAKRLKALESE